MWEPSGCCCFSLRTGSLIMASLVIGFGILSMISYTDFLIKNDLDEMVHEVCKDEAHQPENCDSIAKSGAIAWISTVFVINFIKVCFSILLVHGIRKNMTSFMVPYMIMVLMSIILLILISVLLIVGLMVVGYVQYALAAGVILGAITFLETYCLLVVRALFFELKREKGQAHMTLKEDVYIPQKA